MLATSAIDWMILRGIDYEDGPLLNQNIRESRVKGCSGVTYIDPESNDRSPDKFNIFNVQFDEEE